MCLVAVSAALRQYLRQEKERFNYRCLRWRNARVRRRWVKRQQRYAKTVYRDTTYSVAAQDAQGPDLDFYGFGGQKGREQEGVAKDCPSSQGFGEVRGSSRSSSSERRFGRRTVRFADTSSSPDSATDDDASGTYCEMNMFEINNCPLGLKVNNWNITENRMNEVLIPFNCSGANFGNAEKAGNFASVRECSGDGSTASGSNESCQSAEGNPYINCLNPFNQASSPPCTGANDFEHSISATSLGKENREMANPFHDVQSLQDTKSPFPLFENPHFVVCPLPLSHQLSLTSPQSQGNSTQHPHGGTGPQPNGPQHPNGGTGPQPNGPQHPNGGTGPQPSGGTGPQPNGMQTQSPVPAGASALRGGSAGDRRPHPQEETFRENFPSDWGSACPDRNFNGGSCPENVCWW